MTRPSPLARFKNRRQRAHRCPESDALRRRVAELGARIAAVNAPTPLLALALDYARKDSRWVRALSEDRADADEMQEETRIAREAFEAAESGNQITNSGNPPQEGA